MKAEIAGPFNINSEPYTITGQALAKAEAQGQLYEPSAAEDQSPEPEARPLTWLPLVMILVGAVIIGLVVSRNRNHRESAP